MDLEACRGGGGKAKLRPDYISINPVNYGVSSIRPAMEVDVSSLGPVRAGADPVKGGTGKIDGLN